MWSSLELYDDGRPPWDQPGAEPDPWDEIDDHLGAEEVAPDDAPEPVVMGHPDIMVIGEPVPNSWGGGHRVPRRWETRVWPTADS